MEGMIRKSEVENALNNLIKSLSQESQMLYSESRIQFKHDKIIEYYSRVCQNNEIIDKLEELRRELLYG